MIPSRRFSVFPYSPQNHYSELFALRTYWSLEMAKEYAKREQEAHPEFGPLVVRPTYFTHELQGVAS